MKGVDAWIFVCKGSKMWRCKSRLKVEVIKELTLGTVVCLCFDFGGRPFFQYQMRKRKRWDRKKTKRNCNSKSSHKVTWHKLLFSLPACKLLHSCCSNKNEGSLFGPLCTFSLCIFYSQFNTEIKLSAGWEGAHKYSFPTLSLSIMYEANILAFY